MQANRKTLEGKQHADRDAQFDYISRRVQEFQAGGQPVVSVDAKKKELLGALPQRGPGVAAEGAAGRKWMCMISPTRSSARRSPTGSTI